MPNYSHGTKLTLASVEEPPYLTVGTDVSAKYKGAFCEAKIIDVNKHVKLRVLFDGLSGSYLIDDTDLKAGSTLATGTRIEAKHPEKKQQTYVHATITKILDHSRYTVVFDDGDQCILRRNSLCLKSGKHFAESETLDQLPLTNPEHFGNPVKVGGSEQLNIHSNVTQNDTAKQQQNNTPKSTQNNTPKQTQNNTTKTQNNHLLLNDKPTKVKSSGKRRESVNNGSKNAMDLDDNSVDSSIESGDANSAETNVKYELIDVGVKLMVQYGKGKVQNFYEAKVNKVEINNAGKIRYFVHYTGWNNRYDEWITKSRIHSIVIDKENGSRDRKSRNTDTLATNSTLTPVTSSTTSITPKAEPKEKEKEKEREKEKEKEREKEKEKEKEREKEKEKEREREKEKEREREKEREKEKEKEKEREKEKEKEKEKGKEVLPRTRRARQSEVLINTHVTPNNTQVAPSNNNSVTVNSSISIATTTTSVTSTPMTIAPVATSASTAPVTQIAPVTATPLTASGPPAQTKVDSTKDVPTPPVVVPTTQAALTPSTVIITPKTESIRRDKEAPRTRRARQSDTSTNNAPITSNSTQIAPSSTNSVTVNSSISISITTSVTTTPATLSAATKPASFSVTTTPAIIAASVATTPVTTSPVTTLPPAIATTRLTTSSAPSAQVITVDSTKVVSTPALVSPTIQAASIEKVKDLHPVDEHPPSATDSRPTYRFCDEIDESDCDKKISILQERIMALRQTYTSLKTELADLDRRKKRPRTERSNSDHISNCSVVCRS